MRLNESIIKNLKESTIYRNAEDNRDFLEVEGDRLVNTSVGDIITDDFGEFVGITQVEQTKYIVLRKNNA